MKFDDGRKEKNYGRIVTDGNGKGHYLNQLEYPTFLFIDDDVMKWMRDAKEGIIVAGGNGKEDRFIQLSSALRLIVDQCGQIYIADWDNRVMRYGVKEKSKKESCLVTIVKDKRKIS